MDGESDARIAREREYHNQRFTTETRTAQGKYYAAIKHGSRLFDTRLTEYARSSDVLEYGCGVAAKAFSLAPGSLSVTGIDISDEAIAHATTRARDMGVTNLRFLTMDAERMTFPDASFDLVFGRGIIHHLELEPAFREIARVLRPAGRALFWEPLGHNPLLNSYRRATPEARTQDEHPLLRSDFAITRRYFASMTLEFFGLTTLLSVPLRDTAAGDTILSAAAALDRMLFRIPGIKWQAWHCLIELQNPLPRASWY